MELSEASGSLPAIRQVAQNYRSGTIKLETVNAPALKPGGVLVKTDYSVISSGTEGMKVREAKLSYLGKARARPDQVKKVLATLRQQGFVATYRKIMDKLDALTPLGYSLSGVVVAVGPGAEQFQVGQRVACAGAGYANHAELNFIPKNLVADVPEKVSSIHAAFSTIGAIALQGFRQSGMTLGEHACVIGLGLLGQLLVQILRSAGVRVIGVDLLASRCELARRMGAAEALVPNGDDVAGAVMRATRGAGADCVFLCAGSNANDALEVAVQVARDRARIVDIGKTKLDLPWNDCYLKELDVRFSRSYGPGRYDANYEERGIDYPIAYVRWTEKRNMQAFLDLVADGKLDLDPLISATVDFESAEQVYAEIAAGKHDGLGIVFRYPQPAEPQRRYATVAQTPRRMHRGAVALGVIGAGNYACSMLLPHLRRDDVRLVQVATTNGLSGADVRQRFGFEDATTRAEDILENPEIDAVLIATRHASHARLAAASLRAGKATYVEKPLALTPDELRLVSRAIADTGNRRLFVGFNRRFSPLMQTLASAFAVNGAPLAMLYRVHAGQLEPGSWYLDASEGGRFLGEAGHFFDLFAYLARARPVSVSAHCLRPEKATRDELENLAVTVQYADGSIGNLLYLTQGDAAVPKELLEVFGAGRTARLNNFDSLEIYRDARMKRVKDRRRDKGQRTEMGHFVRAVKDGLPMPVSVDELVDTSLCAIATLESLRRDCPVRLSDFAVSA